MPTILRLGPYRFFFYSLEAGEPPHIHVEDGSKTAKFWLEPVELARSQGLRNHELSKIRLIVIESRLKFLEAWNVHFGKTS